MKIDLLEMGDDLTLDFEETAATLGIAAEELEILTPIAVHLRAIKTEQGVFIRGTISTKARQVCSRCLEPYNCNLKGSFEVEYRRAGAKPPYGEGEEVWLSKEDLESETYEGNTIDLVEEIRQNVFLALPMKPICKEECQGLCPFCGQNLNKGRCSCLIVEADPRFKILGKLLKKEEDR